MWSDEAQQAEGLQMLSALVQFEEGQSSHGGDSGGSDNDEDVNRSNEALAQVYHTLAMLHYLLHNLDKALRSTSLTHRLSSHVR